MTQPRISKSIENSNTLVCVDSYEQKILKGKFFNIGIGKWESFESAIDFLVKLENILETVNLPQAFTTMRYFNAKDKAESSGEPGENKGSGLLATFNVRILFRQNASWQGTVTWLEGKQEEGFRSVLELILLIHSALAADK